ncbi:hypothetical protein HYW84_00540 [Candidatus Peregrinibacteria bacterium]|nr:hypothetical protein [Candidatus Peregrinibacteria bacterium]
MKHTFTYIRSSCSFREPRLCFQIETGRNGPLIPEVPVPPTLRATHPAVAGIIEAMNRIPGFPQINAAQMDRMPQTFTVNGAFGLSADAVRARIAEAINKFLSVPASREVAGTGKLTIEQRERIAELRAKLTKLQIEVKTAAVLKESTEKLESLKRQRQALAAIDEAIRDFQVVDPEFITNLERELDRPGIVKQLREILAQAVESPTFHEQVQKILGVVSDPRTFIEQLENPDADSFEKHIRNSLIEPLLKSEALQPWMKRALGIGLTTEKIATFLFDFLRAKIANFLATSTLVPEGSDFYAVGKDMYRKMAVENHRKILTRAALRARPPLPAPTEQELQVEDRVMTRWEELFDIWAANARYSKANGQRFTQGPPTIASAQKHLQSGAPLPRRLDEDMLSPQPTTLTERRTFDTLIFNPPNFELPVTESQVLTVTINGTRMQFRKDGGNLQMRAGSDDSAPFRTFYDANNTTRAASLTLVAASANAGDVEIRANGRNQGVRLSVLQQQVTATANQNMNRITFTNPTTLAFSA